MLGKLLHGINTKDLFVYCRLYQVVYDQLFELGLDITGSKIHAKLTVASAFIKLYRAAAMSDYNAVMVFLRIHCMRAATDYIVSIKGVHGIPFENLEAQDLIASDKVPHLKQSTALIETDYLAFLTDLLGYFQQLPVEHQRILNAAFSFQKFDGKINEKYLLALKLVFDQMPDNCQRYFPLYLFLGNTSFPLEYRLT